ncbi:hypothetical protein X743_03665 [Mesorhizobium sp. LNHC252B00]|nr:hypothetical protein X743_03665 [Mesorhizobium sp. LNHC252B00]
MVIWMTTHRGSSHPGVGAIPNRLALPPARYPVQKPFVQARFAKPIQPIDADEASVDRRDFVARLAGMGRGRAE